jgi:hypothetical protein
VENAPSSASAATPWWMRGIDSIAGFGLGALFHLFG